MTRRRFLAATAALAANPAAGNAPGDPDWQEGIRLYAAEQYLEAQRSFERAIHLDPRNATYRLWLGRALGRRAAKLTGLRRLGALGLAKKIRLSFEEAVELDGTNLEALESLLRFYLEAPGWAGGSKAEAQRVADRIERLDQARGARARAAYYESLRDFEQAEEQYASARERDPGNTGYLLAHAAFLARRRELPASDALFEEALARDPGNPEAWLAAAKAWIRAERKELYPRARQLLEDYLASPDRAPDSEPASQVRKLLPRP